MNKARLAAQARTQLDKRYGQIGPVGNFEIPVRGWIKAVREALGMTTAQLADRLNIKQPSVVAMEKSEANGAIQLATLRRVAEALDCTLVYSLVPNKTLAAKVRDRARAFDRRRREPIKHTMRLEDQGVESDDVEARIDETVRETDPRLFWD